MLLMRMTRFWVALLALFTLSLASLPGTADAQSRNDYTLGPGDVLRIQVFQSTDLTVEARISESGVISYPLLGVVKLAGLSPQQAETLISTRLKEGKFLQNPQVTLNVLQFRSQQAELPVPTAWDRPRLEHHRLRRARSRPRTAESDRGRCGPREDQGLAGCAAR